MILSAEQSPRVPSQTGIAMEEQKTVALICTTIWRASHAQHIADRFLHGYPRGGRWHKPGALPSR